MRVACVSSVSVNIMREQEIVRRWDGFSTHVRSLVVTSRLTLCKSVGINGAWVRVVHCGTWCGGTECFPGWWCALAVKALRPGR